MSVPSLVSSLQFGPHKYLYFFTVRITMVTISMPFPSGSDHIPTETVPLFSPVALSIAVHPRFLVTVHTCTQHAKLVLHCTTRPIKKGPTVNYAPEALQRIILRDPGFSLVLSPA